MEVQVLTVVLQLVEDVASLLEAYFSLSVIVFWGHLGLNGFAGDVHL